MVGYVDSGHAGRQTMRVGIVLAILLFTTLGQSRCPGLNGEGFSPQAGSDVLELSPAGGLIDSGQVRLTVRHSWRGGSKVGLSLGSARDSWCLVVKPLSVERCCVQNAQMDRGQKDK